MFDIELDKAISAQDPDLAKGVKDNRPPVAAPTGVPNRHTTFVPSENTTFSLGEKCKDRIDDVGITGRTDNHVHFHVTKNNKTVVSLGGPATEVTGDLCIDSHDDKVPHASNGYSMVTDENAWHDAKKQHYLVSREADIVVRTVGEKEKATALVQSDFGCTTIGAGENVTVGAKGNVKIFAHPELPMEEDEKYEKAVGRKMTKEFDGEWAKKVVSRSDKIQTAYAVITEAVHLSKKLPLWGKPGWEAADCKDAAAMFVEGGKLIYELCKPEHKEGGIEMIAEAEISQLADEVSIFGTMGVGISSALTVDLVGTTAGMKAALYGGVWSGLESSLKAGQDVAIEAERGETEVLAKKDVTVASETAHVKVTGETGVQLNSGKGSAMMHGAKGVYCGAGEGAGYGFGADSKGVHVGKFSSADKFEGPGPVGKEGLFVGKDAVGGRFKQSMFRALDSGVEVDAPAVDVKAKGNVTIKGDKVLLG